MNCAEYEEWISVDLDGELAASEAAQLHEHVRGCTKCARVLEDYKLNRMLVRNLESRKAPADALARIGARLAGSAPSRPGPVPGLPVLRRRRTIGGWMRALRAVASIAIVFVGALAWLGWTDPDAPDTVDLWRQTSVRPRVLMRGYAYLQATNPVADGSAWHYLASEDDIVMPTGEEEEDFNQSSDAGRELWGM